jgi:hypothetical protein
MTQLEHTIDQINNGHAVADIGQLSKSDRRALDNAVRQKTIEKWRGCWHPIPGAPFGIGPLKTCYGPIGWMQRYNGVS